MEAPIQHWTTCVCNLISLALTHHHHHRHNNIVCCIIALQLAASTPMMHRMSRSALSSHRMSSSTFQIPPKVLGCSNVYRYVALRCLALRCLVLCCVAQCLIGPQRHATVQHTHHKHLPHTIPEPRIQQCLAGTNHWQPDRRWLVVGVLWHAQQDLRQY
jgi:hypothetical protein